MTQPAQATAPASAQALRTMLRALRLPSFQLHHEAVARRAEREGWSFGQFLHELAELELEGRRARRIKRHRKASNLPSEKSLSSLDRDRLPSKVKARLGALCEGGFAERAENILVFGLPGRGKTHVVAAIGHALIERGYRVYFDKAGHIVQRLLRAKRDLVLEKELKRLDRFDVLILDDIGYIEQSREEMEVLFVLLAERYERRSVMLTSNLVFEQWDRIFKDPMTTAAAIDRVIHHATILEMTGPSIRGEEARERLGLSNDTYPRPGEDDLAQNADETAQNPDNPGGQF